MKPFAAHRLYPAFGLLLLTLIAFNPAHSLAFMPINVNQMKHKPVVSEPDLMDRGNSTSGVKLTNGGGAARPNGFFPINRPLNMLPRGNFVTAPAVASNPIAQRLARTQIKQAPKPDTAGDKDGAKVKSPESKFGLRTPAYSLPRGRALNLASASDHIRTVDRSKPRQINGTQASSNRPINASDAAIMELFGEAKIAPSHPFAKSVKGSELAWPLPEGGEQRLSSTFGKRMDPFSGEDAIHQGIDIVAKKGTAIIASASGVVTGAGKQARLGSFVTIEHQQGLSTQYGHLEDVLVKEGQSVRQGQVIGHVGMTGRTTGPHLHYAVLVNEKHIDPLTRIAIPFGVRTLELSSVSK